jgi:hypothetical protein
MKSIQNQYIDLKEGRMSQANFMRNVRMTLPQYITNVTSFKDAVRILKNKSILTENMNPEEDEMDDLIKKIGQEEEEEKAIKSGFGIQDPMEENQDYFPRDPEEMAQAIADEFRDELLSLSGIERERMAISHAYEKILNSGHPKAKIIARNLAFGYADEDWPMDYISSLFQILRKEDLKEGKKKKEPKAELHPNQIHPQELRMGIKVELEHTDDLDKAKKIALDHLAENPFYYTALKLAGVESPSAPKAKAPVEKKARKKKEAVELVDKANAMQKVKLKEEIDPEIEGKPSQAYLDFLARKKQGENVMQAINADGVKFSVNDRAVAPDGKEIKITGFTKGVDGKMKAIYSAGMYADVYDLDALKKKPSFRPGVDLGASFEKFKSTLEALVREVVNETFDGRDNLANITDDTK